MRGAGGLECCAGDPPSAPGLPLSCAFDCVIRDTMNRSRSLSSPRKCAPIGQDVRRDTPGGAPRASCHGANGEGVPDEYEDPLVGDRSIKSLAKLIERTMPEQDEKLCVGEDAQKVAAFIHGAFYSPEARARAGQIGSARIELARRTVPQYRNAIADIIASLDPKRTGPSYKTGGLRGGYFSSDKMNKKHKHGLDRLDPVIDFDFKDAAPTEDIDPTQFSIAWEGSLVAPSTGTYEFRVTTPNGARLYVNADLKEGDRNYRDDSSAPSRVPLIDGWVSDRQGSADNSPHAVELLGGRRYPIRLDYFKYKEKLRLDQARVETAARQVVAPKTANTYRRIPRRAPWSSPPRSPPTTAATATNGVPSISKRVARGDDPRGRRGRQRDPRSRSTNSPKTHKRDPKRAEKLSLFAARFTEAAFRRPLTEMPRTRSTSSGNSPATENPDTALKRCVLLRPQVATQFLYTELPAKRLKTRPLHGCLAPCPQPCGTSTPDPMLLALAAKQNSLQNAQSKSPARHGACSRIRVPRRSSTAFFEHWLELEERDLSKDSKMLSRSSIRDTVADLRHSLETVYR